MGRFSMFGALMAASLPATLLAASAQSTPVLLELFTSEGCSSCPPADALLQKLDRTQPVDGAALVVLSEHVDYWNQGGWRDPYSSRAASERQEDYARRLGVADIYTPQLIVDGSHQALGSNWVSAKQAIEQSLHTPKLPITLKSLPSDAGLQLSVEVPSTSGSSPSADVYLALAADYAPSSVTAGENAGRRLSHVAVAYSIKKIGAVNANRSFSKDLRIRRSSGGDRIVVFLQDPKSRRILGVAQTGAAQTGAAQAGK